MHVLYYRLQKEIIVLFLEIAICQRIGTSSIIIKVYALPLCESSKRVKSPIAYIILSMTAYILTG